MKIAHLSIPLALALTCAFAMPAVAEEDFNSLMTEGVSFFKAGNYVKAIESFQKAQKLDNIPDISYNIARSYQLLGDCDLALKYYREYALTSTENAASVQEHIKTLSEQCGTKTGSLVLKCTPANAMVTIDFDSPVPCNSTYEIKTGEHQLRFTATNYNQETRVIDITENQSRNVVIELKPNPNAPKQNASSQNAQAPADEQYDNMPRPFGPPPHEPISKLFWAGIGTSGGGLVFSIAGIAMLATSHREISHNGTSGYYERSTPKLAGGAVMAGIGITAMTAGVILLVVDKFLYRPAPPPPEEFSFSPSISITPDAASASLTMTF